MADPQNSKDPIVAVLDRFKGDNAMMSRHKKEYPLVLTQTKGEAKLHPDHHYRLFNRPDGRNFTESELQFLLGSKWSTIQEKHTSESSGKSLTLEKNGARIDMLNIEPSKRMSEVGGFNILGKGRGILVYDETNSEAEMPAMVNLCITLTLEFCKSSCGLLLWQAKVQSSKNDEWSRVPDVLYLDYVWLPEERERFQKAGYREQRDFLCANLHLHQHDVVLPFVVDFTGHQCDDYQDARVTAAIDGNGAPKAAISVPGAAYVGWYSEMAPDQSVANKKLFYSAASGNVGAQWLLSAAQKTATRRHGFASVCGKIKTMYQSPQENALIYYIDVIELDREARLAARTDKA